MIIHTYSDEKKPKRLYSVHFVDTDEIYKVEANSYTTTILFCPAGHHFFIDNVRVAFFAADNVRLVTSEEIKE